MWDQQDGFKSLAWVFGMLDRSFVAMSRIDITIEWPANVTHEWRRKQYVTLLKLCQMMCQCECFEQTICFHNAPVHLQWYAHLKSYIKFKVVFRHLSAVLLWHLFRFYVIFQHVEAFLNLKSWHHNITINFKSVKVKILRVVH